jgi:hypothetical protein
MYKGTLSVKKEIIIHVFFWVVWLYFNITSIDKNGVGFLRASLFSWTWLIVNLVTFYFNYLIILPKVFKPFNWKKSLLGIICVYIFFIGFRYFTEQIFTLLFFDRQNYTADVKIIYYVYDNLLFGIKPIILSTIFWLIVFMVRLLEYNRIILEENKNTEIKFLKAQINPHFVFNTLNNIYSMVYFHSEKSLPAIEKLSQIMRFTTYESQKEKIKLSDEIDYIRAYIELEQLRHQEEAFVHFGIETDNDNIEVPPYILSPLVENALKHGAASDYNPIEIKLIANAQVLTFTVENEIGTQAKDKSGGIGLENLKRRLEIYYSDRYSLKLTNRNNRFVAELQIDLK